MISRAAMYLLKHLPDFKYRDVVQEFFTIPDRTLLVKAEDGSLQATTSTTMFVGKLFLGDDGMLWRTETFQRIPNTKTYTVTVSPTNVPVPKDTPVVSAIEPCEIIRGDIANYTDPKPLETTVGRLLINYLLFADPFGDIIPYHNKPFKGSYIEGVLSEALIEDRITVEQFYHYVRNLNYIGHIPDFVAVNLTPKSLITDPAVKERKKKLLLELKDRLDAGDATAMAQIESELIGMDKAWLKDDPSMRFLLKGKYFANVRKKLLLTTGSIESFSTAGQYAFVSNSLEEGWTQAAFPVIANEIRAGSYSRARETAKGGEESKFLLRVFQNTRITEQDCKTKRFLAVDVDAHNAEEYLYRNYIKPDGSIGVVTEDSMAAIEGKTVHFRSPMYCGTKDGYCYTCMGKLLETLGRQVLASAVNEIGSAMLARALAKVHKSGVSVVDLGPLNKYLVK